MRLIILPSVVVLVLSVTLYSLAPLELHIATACKKESLSSCQPKLGGWRTPLGTPCVPVHHTYDDGLKTASETASRRLSDVYSQRSAALLKEQNTLQSCIDLANNALLYPHLPSEVQCENTNSASIISTTIGTKCPEQKQFCDPYEPFHWNVCKNNQPSQCKMTCTPICRPGNYLSSYHAKCQEGLSYDLITQQCLSNPQCKHEGVKIKYIAYAKDNKECWALPENTNQLPVYPTSTGWYVHTLS